MSEIAYKNLIISQGFIDKPFITTVSKSEFLQNTEEGEALDS